MVATRACMLGLVIVLSVPASAFAVEYTYCECVPGAGWRCVTMMTPAESSECSSRGPCTMDEACIHDCDSALNTCLMPTCVPLVPTTTCTLEALNAACSCPLASCNGSGDTLSFCNCHGAPTYCTPDGMDASPTARPEAGTLATTDTGTPAPGTTASSVPSGTYRGSTCAVARIARSRSEGEGVSAAGFALCAVLVARPRRRRALAR